MIKLNQKFWVYNLTLWSVVAVFTTTQLYLKSLLSGQAEKWFSIFWIQLCVWLIWATITPIIFKLAKKFRIEKKYLSNALILLLVTIGLVLVYLSIYTMIWLLATYKSIALENFKNLYKALFVNLFHWHFFICMAIIAVVHAHMYYKDSETERIKGIRLEKDLIGNRLKMLKMQLRPHFLFNTLNGIVSAIQQKNTKVASEMTTELGELLRISLNEKESMVVSLEEELDYVQKYLQIEQYRFKDLDVVYEIQKETLKVEVPNFFLQPIVENAVKHGIAKSSGRRLLKISIQIIFNNELQIDIYNQGPSLIQREEGIGLQNVRQQLYSYYGKSASLKLHNLDNGVNARINFPAS